MNPILIAITDDDTLLAKLLENFLNTVTNFKVAFTAESGNELISRLREAAQLPDILLLDLKMKEMDGIEITKHLKIHFPSIKIIVISSHYQRSFMGFMFKTGASAFLPKGISPAILAETIEAVHYKGFYFLEEQMETIREQISSKAPKPILDDEGGLSEREIQILRLISQQKTAKAIGEILFITPRTVEGHKNNLFIKTGAKNITGLVIYAIQHNIIKIEDLPLI